MVVHYNNIWTTLERLEPQSLHHEVPLVWDWSSGSSVYSNGDEYIDFTSGIFVANIGHRHPEVTEAIIDELDTGNLHTYIFPNKQRAKLVETLVRISGMDKVYLCSTGSEAVEAAIRCMRAYRNKTLSVPVYGVVGAFHGNTEGAKRIIKCLNDGDSFLEPPAISGIIIESYLGYNAKFHNISWMQRLVNEARDRDVPICFDEIQAGFGRTGKMFAFEHYGVKPDLICVGKALGGGLPISAVLGRADLLDAPPDLSSTHTGNPICCAAANASLEVLEKEHLVEKGSQMGLWIGPYLRDLFPEYQVNGKGMIWAIELKDIDLANRVVEAAIKMKLLLVKTHKGTIKIGPPLSIKKSKLREGIKIIRRVLDEYQAHRDCS